MSGIAWSLNRVDTLDMCIVTTPVLEDHTCDPTVLTPPHTRGTPDLFALAYDLIYKEIANHTMPVYLRDSTGTNFSTN